MSGQEPPRPDHAPRAPAWIRWLLARLAEPGRADEVVGDAEESYRTHAARSGKIRAQVASALEALDMARALVGERVRGPALRAGVSSLDVRLGLRMMAKHPAVSVLSTLAIAFAIFVGAGAFEFISQVVFPSLPLSDGDRVVGLRLWDASRSRAELRVLHDLTLWSEELRTVQDLGTFRPTERNLVTPDGRGAALSLAEMDPVGFRVAGTPAMLGRTLVDDDARPEAPAVMVIGHRVWASRFGADPDVVGRSVRLDGEPTTVVGVMPPGFAFPVNDGAWIPSKLRSAAIAPLEGPDVLVFGLLAPGASLRDARLELEVIGDRVAANAPDAYEHVRPQVMRWPQIVMGLPGGAASTVVAAIGLASNLPLVLFLVLVCGNVGLLMFARAASRETELVVRTALGASRRRIVLQLFIESLLLAAVGCVGGLAAAGYALRWVLRITESILLEGAPLPFWFHARLSPTTVLYAGLLAVLAATVAGVLPGLRTTRDLAPQLQRATAGGGGGRFGGIWTVVIVVQIAATMFFPLLVASTRATRDHELAEDLDLPGEQYLSARLGMMSPDEDGVDDGSPEGPDDWRGTQYAPAVQRLEEQLANDSRVRGVTFTERLPRQYHPWRQIEVDGPMAEPPDVRGHRLGSADVAIDYFDVMGARVLAGRAFLPSDLQGEPGVTVVNQSFVTRVLGGRNAVGQRVRYLSGEGAGDPSGTQGPWMEIVGVVEDLGTLSGYGPTGMYHPIRAGDVAPGYVVVHVEGDARAFAPELERVASAVDPRLRLERVITLDHVTDGQRVFFTFWTIVSALVSGLALLLSLGGIFAVMSWTVSRRTREIGVRVALGSSRTRVVGAVFRRPLIQIALGVLAGGGLLFTLVTVSDPGWPDARWLVFIAGYMPMSAAVFLLACVVPTKRALAVEPSEALRAEG